MASDIGPMINQAKYREAKMGRMPKRRQSKSVDDVELAEIKKSIDEERNKREIGGKRELLTNKGPHTRRRSKDDHDLPSKPMKIKDSHYYVSEQRGFRKRFSRLFGSLRNRQHIQLHGRESPSPPPPSDGEAADDKTVGKTNKESNISRNEEPNIKKNNEVNYEETTIEDREYM